MAQESSEFDSWSGKLAFWSAVVQSPEMAERLAMPGLTHQDRASMIEKVTGDELNDNGRNFIRLLSENNRLALIPDIHGIYEGLRSDACLLYTSPSPRD